MSHETFDKKTIKVLYFGVFREQRGTSEENVRTTSKTALELYTELSALHTFPLDHDDVRVAVNETLRDWQTPLAEGDTVVFLAPFGGG